MEKWNVYFLAKRGDIEITIEDGIIIREHAMIGWEGLYSHGQRVIKMAELTVETIKSGPLNMITKTQMMISYFRFEMERIHSFRKHYIFAAFRASKEKVKEMEKSIESEIGDMPGKYKKILGSGSEVSGGLSSEERDMVTTNCQKWVLEKLEQCLDLPDKILQNKMAMRPSATTLALQLLPQAVKGNKSVAHTARLEELEAKEVPQQAGSRCLLM